MSAENREDYTFSKEVIHADRAWNSLEQGLAAKAEAAGQPEKRTTEIVDIDVLEERGTPITFANRDEVRARYEDLLAESSLGNMPNGGFIGRRLTAQLFHLELLENGIDSVSVFEHVKVATGSELKLIDETVIDERQAMLEEELGRHGLGFDAAYAEAFQERLGLPAGKKAMERHLIEFAHRTGMLDDNENSQESLAIPKIVEQDEPWVGYFSTDELGAPFSQINAHGRHSYTRGRAAAVAAHEASHARDFAQRRTAILREDMDPLQGVNFPPGPEMVVIETIALEQEQYILRGVQGDNAAEYHLQAAYHDYVEMPRNNALYHINTGQDEDEVVDYLRRRKLPNETEENLRKTVQVVRDDPYWRAYFSVFEPAMRISRQMRTMPAEKRKEFLHEISQHSYSEAEMQAMLDGRTTLQLVA